MSSPADEANRLLVDQLIARGALWSRALIAAFRATPRHPFLDRVYYYSRRLGRWRAVDTREPGPTALKLVYADRAVTTRLSAPGPGKAAVPISSSSQPSLMAQMLEDLQSRPGLRVLEVGAGTGYNAALLARVVGPVVSIDVDRKVLAGARRHLESFPDRTVELRHADGRDGCPERAPFDRIVVTAATPDLEPTWLTQLAPAGILQAPLALAPGLAFLVQGTVTNGIFEGRLTRPAYFMPLREEDTTGDDPTRPGYTLPAPGGLTTVSAPWAGWAERPTYGSGPGFRQSLAFLGWLEGLAVGYQAGPDGRPAYGVADLVRGHACWLGSRQWYVTGTAGKALADRLWEVFLESGGPSPSEFRLRASPTEPPPAATEGVVLRAMRQGPRCHQLWELSDPRSRPPWD